jgi:DNA processing protein
VPGEDALWAGLTRLPGIGPRRLSDLLNACGGPEGVWRARAAELQAVPGISPELAERIVAARQRTDLTTESRTLQRLGVKVLVRGRFPYPPVLASIPAAPPVLFWRGELAPGSGLAVAVVGARRCTEAGRRLATCLAADLAQTGILVVSGLAYGIDAAAHRGCLAAGGHTIAVLGCGVDYIYPPAHSALAGQVMVKGALMSEYPPGVRPARWHFPARNRLISGLAVAVVVVEAGEDSGALITARLAGEQGRQVCAYPGRVGDRMSAGCLALIKDGAHLVCNAQDVLDILRLTGSA